MIASNMKKRAIVAFSAAFMLVVQTLLSVWALAPSEPTLDAFGNPLCITGDHATGNGPAGDHGKGSTCCMLACSQLQPLAGALPQEVAMDLRPGLFARPPANNRDANWVERPEFDPGSARAPPTTV